MGDPRKHRAKFRGPSHPWQKERIEEERKLFREYGLVNKREIYKIDSFKRGIAKQAKQLAIAQGAQAQILKDQLFKKLQRLGLLKEGAELGDILAISVRDILERRLQTQVYKRMLANSAKQARQFITHGHIKVGDRRISGPGYLVSADEEALIAFVETSELANPEHPERTVQRKPIVAEEKSAEEKKPQRRGRADDRGRRPAPRKAQTPRKA